MRIVIVKTGSTRPEIVARLGDFEDWFRAGLELAAGEAPVVAPPDGDALPDPATVRAAIVTGSPAMVTDRAPWSVACAAWLRELVGRGGAVLGVCYGHQLLADALGGTVGPAPRGRELGSVRVELTGDGRADPLFAGLPPVLDTQAAHAQSALVLPTGARRLAGNAHDANQAFAFGPRAWGVQFHPEFDADVVRAYVRADAETLRAEGLDPDSIAAHALDSDHGRRILRNFRSLV